MRRYIVALIAVSLVISALPFPSGALLHGHGTSLGSVDPIFVGEDDEDSASVPRPRT